jgi:hypothetical protein
MPFLSYVPLLKTLSIPELRPLQRNFNFLQETLWLTSGNANSKILSTPSID